MKIEDFNQYGISYVDALAFYREYTSPQLSNIERASLAKAFANNHGFHVAMTYRLLDLVDEGQRKISQLENKFIVINKKHIEEFRVKIKNTDPETRDIVSNVYNDFCSSVENFQTFYEITTGKRLNQKYIVCNQDEPYAGEVARIILDGEMISFSNYGFLGSIKEYMGNQYYGFWMSLFKLFRGYRIKKPLVPPKVLKQVAKGSNQKTKEV